MIYIVIVSAVVFAIVALVLAIRKQGRVTRSVSIEEGIQNARVF